jgi:hypothetical protein
MALSTGARTLLEDSRTGRAPGGIIQGRPHRRGDTRPHGACPLQYLWYYSFRTWHLLLNYTIFIQRTVKWGEEAPVVCLSLSAVGLICSAGIVLDALRKTS